MAFSYIQSLILLAITFLILITLQLTTLKIAFVQNELSSSTVFQSLKLFILIMFLLGSL
jgi:hypothetical protein